MLNAEEKKKFMKNQMNTGKIQVIMQLFVHLLIMRVQAYFSKNDWKSQIYSVSITYIYQRLCGYLKSTQRFYIAFHLEDHPEEEYPVDLPDESMMSFGEPKSYLTFDDVRRLTGLSKKELKKKLKEKQIVAMYDEDAVRQAFDEDIC